MAVKFNKPARRTTQDHASQKRVTQQEIARVAGVSHVAVSYALHRKLHKRISPEKQQEIRRIAKAMGYQPRALTTYTIGLALPVHSLRLDITTSQIVIADGILREKGYRLTIAAFDEQHPSSHGLLLNQKNTDGVLLIDPRFPTDEIIAPDLPRVLMADADEAHLKGSLDQVSMDTRETMKRVVAYAVEKGHQKIGLVASVQRSVYDNHLREGFRAAFKEQALPLRNTSVIEVGNRGNTAGPLLNSLSGKDAPTLIIAGSSARALYVLNTLQWAGYRVPDDVSLISFIDSERLPLLHPAVTATTASNQEVVALAIERLLQRIENPDLPTERVLLPGEVIERDSVKAL
jgi:LacI family transcriptional regulator